MDHVEQTRRLVAELQRLGVDPQLLRRVAAQLPGGFEDPDHWVELGAALRRLGNYAAADAVYGAALATHPAAARLWNNYGVLLRDWGKLREALDATGRALALDPAYAKALTNKGKLLELTHRFAEARACYRAALAVDPRDVVATNNTGVCLLGEGDAAGAEAWFEKALRLDPEWAAALFTLALRRLDRGDPGAARPLVDTLSRLLPNDADVARMRARLRDAGGRRPTLEVPRARPLERDVSSAVATLCEELVGDPRSLFISYAWPDPATKRFAKRLARDLALNGYRVMLDQDLSLEVHDVLAVLVSCQNVVALNDVHYAESCLLGKVPVTKVTSPYPSFAFPLEAATSEEYLGMVFMMSAVAWDLAKRLVDRGDTAVADFAFQVTQPDAFPGVPGVRQFVEGWRVDEIQMVFGNIDRFRSLAVAYLGGEHCLAGYPLFDFSDDRYYAVSLAALLRVLQLGRRLHVDDAPIRFDSPDWSDYRWPESRITSATLWRISDQDVAVWRPSFTPDGDHGAVIQRFKDWVPM